MKVKRIFILALCILLICTFVISGCAADVDDVSVEADAQNVDDIDNGSDADLPPGLNQYEILAYEYVRDNFMGRVFQPRLSEQDEQFNFRGVRNLRMNSWLTGEASQSRTRTRFDMGGTDLGFPLVMNDGSILYFFGDSFSGMRHGGTWRCNAILRSTDMDPTDGIFFDSAWTRRDGFIESGRFSEFIPGAKRGTTRHVSYPVEPHHEVTTIPTGAFLIGDTIYVTYMSVEWWGPPGVWAVGHGSMARSTDGGVTWEKIHDKVIWPGDTYPMRPAGNKYRSSEHSSGFEQSHPVDGNDGYIYFFGIPGGRNESVKLMRVAYEYVEVQDNYEYLVGYDDDGNPIWMTHADGGMWEAIHVIVGTVGEMSIMYSYYLEEWLITFISPMHNNDMVIMSAKELWGPFSAPQQLVPFDDFPTLYGAFMIPAFQSADDPKIYFVMSIWGFPPNFNAEVYNSFLMEIELIRGD